MHGSFNGDCHPGNILLLSDGRLGLIDFGQVKTLPLHWRITYAKLIKAHAKGNREEIIRLHFNEIGTKTKYSDPEVAYLMSSFYNDRDSVAGNLNMKSFIDKMQELDPMIQIPDEMVMVCRMNLLLRGMGKAFGVQLRMSKMWEADAAALLKREGVHYLEDE